MSFFQRSEAFARRNNSSVDLLYMLESHTVTQLCPNTWTPNTATYTHAKTAHTSHHSIFPLPDSAVGAIRVHGSHSSNLGAGRWVFIHVHNVVVQGEDRRLIHITHNDPQWCGILKWPQVGKVGVWVSVGSFNIECVNLSFLIVQRLGRKQKSQLFYQGHISKMINLIETISNGKSHLDNSNHKLKINTHWYSGNDKRWDQVPV